MAPTQATAAGWPAADRPPAVQVVGAAFHHDHLDVVAHRGGDQLAALRNHDRRGQFAAQAADRFPAVEVFFRLDFEDLVAGRVAGGQVAEAVEAVGRRGGHAIDGVAMLEDFDLIVNKGDKNANVIFETLTDYGRYFAMAQVYIPEITAGDKRG